MGYDVTILTGMLNREPIGTIVIFKDGPVWEKIRVNTWIPKGGYPFKTARDGAAGDRGMAQGMLFSTDRGATSYLY